MSLMSKGRDLFDFLSFIGGLSLCVYIVDLGGWGGHLSFVCMSIYSIACGGWVDSFGYA